MKKVIVIGGSGFLGSHVSDCLSNAGYHVTIYDKIKSMWLRSDQKMVIGDVQDVEKLHRIIAGAENDLKGLIAELMGKETGTCAGIGSSQNLCNDNIYSNGEHQAWEFSSIR